MVRASASGVVGRGFAPRSRHTTVKMVLVALLLTFPFNDFIWDSGKLPFPSQLGKYLIKSGKISAKIHEIGKIKAIFGLGLTPI